MPSGKGRSKEDTWKESDLKKAIQGDKKERSSHREDDRRERRSDRDDDRRRRDCREDLMNGEDRDHRRKERSSDKERRRDRDRNGERLGGKFDRNKEKQRERQGETSGRERRGKEQSEKDKESSRDRERHREQDGESTRRKDRREKDKREHEGSEGRRRDRERDKDRERRHRSRREEGDDHRSERKLKERDDETGSDDRRHDRERRRRREEGESSSHHDEMRDLKRERSREKNHRDRRKERELDESRRHRDKSGERKEKRRERDDRERRKEKEEHDADKENKEVSKPGPSRGERFRADTLEEADVIDEEEIRTRKSSIIKTEEFNDEAAYNYEEDFEDYEDDFENEQDDEDDTDLSLGDRSAGMQELLNAINLENETVSREGTKMSRSSDDDSRKEPEVRPVAAKGRINFVAAKQKQISEKVASRTRKRGQELMHLIDLDVVVFEMFDLPPMNEYELYIKNFGRSDTKQAYVQCNDDNLEKEIQTEDIETRTMWTQNPAEDFAGCGDEKGSQDDSSSLTHAAVDSVRLARFLQTAGQACLVLLEEESAEQSNQIVKDKKEMTCSDGYIPLATKQSYLAGRALECLHVSPVQNHLLLTAYGPVTTDQEVASSKTSDNLNAKSIICLWNVNEPSTPKTILICESVPRCCCLSPSKATIAFAGLEDGSVIAWDLRESPSIHHSYNVNNDQVILRSPTFSTAGVLSQDNHHSPVVSLLPVIMPGDSAKASTSVASNLHSDEMLGLSFQLASLEENAVINIWVVVELGVADIAGSESDLGLAPGGKIKLIKSSSLQLQFISTVRDVRKNTALQTYTMQFLPQNPNHFYIGTDNGYVLHRVRHGGRAHPNAFVPEIECLVDVTALDVSPWQLSCILVGNRDGSIRLYNLNNELPVSTWTHSTQGSSIVSVQWSNSIPSVFFALDANSTLYIWDLLKNDSEPVAIEKVQQGSVTSFELSSDYSATGVGVAGRNAELILGYKNGLVEVHKISSLFSKASPDDLDRFSEYLEGAL